MHLALVPGYIACYELNEKHFKGLYYLDNSMLFASLASVRFGNQLLLLCFSFLFLKIYQQHITRCHGFVCKVAKDSSDTAALSLKKKYGNPVLHMYIL